MFAAMFFFKQKTAYEVRISDWSSDVCSSDLEKNPAAKDAIAQILTNSRMSAEGHRPICQDTGIATVFLKVGMNVLWDARLSVTDMVNEGVRRAYNHPDNKLRASVLADPAGKRTNTRDNTPAVIHYENVKGARKSVR